MTVAAGSQNRTDTTNRSDMTNTDDRSSKPNVSNISVVNLTARQLVVQRQKEERLREKLEKEDERIRQAQAR